MLVLSYIGGVLMILFLISFLIVFVSSYLITSCIAKENDVCGFFYIPLIAFAQLVFDFEILSLFKAISIGGVFGLNIITLIAAASVWYIKSRPLWRYNVSRFFKRCWLACWKDKYLFTLGIGFCIFLAVSIFLIIISPVVSEDASSYHVSRSVFWVINKSLNHFTIGDIRNLVFPINSEILYAWVILFTHKMVFLGSFSFVGYLLTILGIYNILDILKFDIRKKLWVLFIVSSFSSVTILSSGTETDIIISGLVLSSIYLFWRGVKDDRKACLFMSALAYALAIGTKTTAFFAIPGVGIGFCALAYYYRKKDFYKPVLAFLGFGVINFLLFAVYNYILNYINFGNITGSLNFIYLHKNIFGLRGLVAHFIKYLFLFVDFTGLQWSNYIGPEIINLRDSILSSMNLSDVVDGVFTAKDKVVNKSLLEPLVGMGVVGMLTFLPCVLISYIRPFFKKDKKTIAILGFGLLFLVNIIVMSYVLIYMAYNIRFLTTLCVISAPVLIYSYSRKNNPYKFLVVFFAMFSLVLISTHIWARPFFRIVEYMKHGVPVTHIRKIMSESMLMQKFPEQDYDIKKYPITYLPYALRTYLSQFDKSNKILYFSPLGKGVLPFAQMKLDGYNVNFDMIENIDNIDLTQYNIILLIDDMQDSFIIKKFNHNYCAYTGVNIDNKQIMLSSKCTLPPEFYEDNGFVLYDAFNKKIYNERLLGEKIDIEIHEDNDYYKIYENKNNPIKR